MTSKERENFLRNAILVVDHSKAALVSLVELDVQHKGQTLEQFVTKNQHEIYHLYNSSWCCQCPSGHRPPHSPRILQQSQMELLFDRSSSKLPCHNTGRRSDDFCCSMTRSGLCTDVLDLTLARCLLVNFCKDVFWYSCLQFQSITLEDFLNHHKHDLYHLWQYNAPCCQCPSGYTFPTNYSVFDQNDWMQMFNAVLLPCTNHRKRPSSGSMHSICSVAAAPGVSPMNLAPFITRIILQHCCTVRMAVDTLVQIRNQDYGHAKEGIMSDNDYNASVVKIERCILEIAKVCNKETQFKQKLREAKDGALDQTLFTQYQNNLMETLTRQADIHQSVTDLAPTINKIGNKLAAKTGKFPKLMDECIKKGYDYQEQLMQRFNQALIKVKNQTHMAIDCHMDEETFVETNAVRKCVDWMDRKDVFVIIGGEGSGKSRIGLEILRQFGLTDEDFDLLKVIDFLQVMDIITDERKTVMLLDGVFPTKKCSYKNFTIDHTLDLLHARLCKGDVKFIFTLDSSNSNSFKGLLASHRLFENCCKIDLSSDRFSMKEGEKATLLFNFCKRFNVGITWDTPGYEGDSKDFYLDGRTVYEIAKTDPFIGYPKSCFMFTSDKRFLQLGINFFKHPDQSLIDEINSLRDCTDINLEMNISYALLVYTLLNTSSFDVNRIDISKLETIIESCGNCQRRRLFDSKVKKIAEQIDGRFLKQDTQTLIYHFKHPMINEAIAISYFEVNPSAVISVLNFEFIIDIIRLERDDLEKQKISLIVAKDIFGFLSKRLFILFEKYYKNRSAEFMKTLCGSSLILQNNPDFIGPLFKQFNNCTSQDTINIQIEDRHEHVSFHFPRALLWFLIQKHNVDKPIATVLYFIENDMKDKQYMEKVEASKKIVLACFYYLCDTNSSDMKLELCYGLINDYDIECNYDYSMQIALKKGNDAAVSFLLNQVSREIDIVKLVLEVEHVEDIRRLCDLISTNISIECIDTDNKTDILKILIRSVQPNFFNVRASTNTACSKRCEDIVTGILSDVHNFTFDTGNVVNTACENGWEDVLKILLNRKLCNQSEKKQIFTASCKDGMETFLKWMFLTVDTDELNVQQFVLHEFRCENFETVQNFILKLQDNKEMETMIKNLVKQFNLPIVRFIQWVLEDTEKQIVTGNKTDLQSLYIVQWIYERFPNLQNDVRKTVYKTINDSCDNSDEILRWLKENTQGMVHPITSLLEFSCKNDLQRIAKWILKTFDYNTFNIHELMIEAFKVGNTKLAEIIIREIDLVKVDVTSIITTMLSSCQNNRSKDLFIFLIQNIDKTCCRWMEIITLIVDLKLYSYIELILKHADNTKIDMTKIVRNKINVLSENELMVFIQSIKRELIDMNYIAWAAFKIGYHEIVSWSIMNDNQNAIDQSEVFDAAVFNGNIDIMHYLLNNTDHKLLDIRGAVDIACRRGKFDIVEVLLLNVNDKEFDVKEAIGKVFGGITFDTVKTLSDSDNLLEINTDKASECERFKIVKLMLETFDHKLFDMTIIMNTANEQRWFDLMKWVIKEVDDSLLDLNEILGMACQSERSDIVTLLAGKIVNSNADIVSVLRTIFVQGSFNVIKLFIANIDLSLINLGAAMNEACRDGKSELVRRLIESDNDKIDLNRLLKIACDRNWLDIIKSIGKSKGIDLNTAMKEACSFRRMDIVRWLIQNIDNMRFDFTTVITNACRDMHIDIVETLIQNVNLNLLGIDNVFYHACLLNNFEQVKWMIEHIDNTLFDINTAMRNACFESKLDTVKWLIENNDNKLFDMKEALNKACNCGNLDMVTWLIENIDNKLFDMKEALNKACNCGNLDMVTWLIENIDNKLFDMKEALNKACNCGNLDMVTWLIENIDNKLFDMKEALNKACNCGNLDMVTWLIENIDNKLFDMKEALNKACNCGNLDMVTWLIENIDNKLFDMKEALNIACENGHLDMVKWLIENIDNKLFDMKEALNIACECGNLDTVKWLIENIDNKLFDMKEALNIACENGHLDMVTWLIENIDNKLFDMKEALNIACECGHLDMVTWLIENIDNKLFDMKEALNKACNCGNLDMVTWLIENIDNKLFDMKEALNIACENGHLDMVKWLIENIDNELFDMKETLNIACEYRHLDMVTWLIENVDNKLFEIQEALNAAGQIGNLHIVEWMIQNVDNTQFDIKQLMNDALNQDAYKIIECLIKNVDNTLFDMTLVMKSAYRCGDLDLMTLVIESIVKSDHTGFNLQSALYMIFDCCNNVELMYNNSIIEESVLKICKQGQKKEIFWTDVLNNACVFGFLEVVEWLLTNFPSNIFDFDTAIANALSSKSDSIIRLIIKTNCDYVTDIRSLTSSLCHHGYTDLALWLLQNQDNFVFDYQTVMNEACLHDDLSLVKYLWDNFNPYSFDMKTAMTKACRGKKSTTTIEWLWRNTDQQLFDMNVAMTNACRYGRETVLEWLWTNVDQSNFRMNEAFHDGCKYEQQPVVRWMIENVPKELLEMSNVLHTACLSNTNDRIVEMLFQQIDISRVNINLMIRETCKHGNTAIIQYLLSMSDVGIIDMNQAMTNILSIDVKSDSYSDDEKVLKDEKKEQLALTIIQKTTLSMLNIDELIIEICKNGWLKLLQLLWSNKDHRNINIDQSTIDIACEYGRENIVLWAVNNLDLDMINVKALMTESCGFGWLEIVKKIWTIVEHGQFDVQSAMNESCSYGRYEVVTWLIQNADNNLFDMNVIMEISCRNGWIDIIKHILPLDLSSCNATVAITAACTTGNVEFVQLLLNQFGKEHINFDQISKSMLTSSKNADLVISLLQNTDFDKFDIRKIFTTACGFGWIDVIKYIKSKASINCNVSGGMIKACSEGEDRIVMYLLQEFPHNRFDFQSTLLAACTKGWDEIAEILLNTVDHNLLHIENNFMSICRSGEADIVNIILKKVDHNLLNLHETITSLTKDKKNEQVVLNIIKNAHKTKWDKQSLSEKAREHSWWKVLAFLNTWT